MSVTENFIGRYNCPENVVDGLINYFNENKTLHRKGYPLNDKDSTDVVCYMPDIHHISLFKEYDEHLSNCINEYCNKFNALRHICKFGLIEPFNIQHYKVEGGYKVNHCERFGFNDFTVKRILFFITYLNDVSDGGTKFEYYNHIEKAIKGKTIICPTDWTHTHCGEISKSQEKIIATGWFSHMWDYNY